METFCHVARRVLSWMDVTVQDTVCSFLEAVRRKSMVLVTPVLETALQEKDKVRVHRIGKRKRGKAGPLTACVARCADKTTMFHKGKESEEKSIGLSSDQTTRQTQEGKQTRSELHSGLYNTSPGGSGARRSS